jgi:integrase
MPSVNFYLKTPEEKTGLSLIYLQFKYSGQKLVFSFNETINPNHWNNKAMRVKDNKATLKFSVQVNDLLDNLETELLSAYRTEKSNGIPDKETLKGYLKTWMTRNVKKEDPTKENKHTLFNLIERFIDGTVGDTKSPATITKYRTSKKHLEAFQVKKGFSVDFDTINLDFKDAFVKYLREDKTVGKGKNKRIIPGLSTNSIHNEIKNLKAFMNMAVEREYTTNTKHTRSSFGVETEETDAVYLTEKEIRNLFKHDFGDNVRLETVKDVFVFSSFVGLRYSDACRIKPKNIVKIDGNDYIKIVSQKTGTPVTIPCNDIVLKILEKYNPLPAPISNQKFNEYIKEVCKLAGLTETGRLMTDLEKPLYQVISSHTARRSFATNCYKAGMDPRMIMSVTGHKTEKSFNSYIKIGQEEMAKRMGEHMRKSFSLTKLQVV